MLRHVFMRCDGVGICVGKDLQEDILDGINNDLVAEIVRGYRRIHKGDCLHNAIPN